MKFLFILLLFPFLIHSQGASSLEKSLLWNIEGENIGENCFLFGTMHLIGEGDFYFPENLQKIIQHSDRIVLEVANVNDPEAVQHLLLKEGSLFDYFTTPQQDSLFRWANESMGYDSLQFRKNFSPFKPFVLVQIAAQQEVFSSTKSYELEIMQLAKKEKIQIDGLETIAQQIGFFDSMDTLQQQKLVLSSIYNNAKRDRLLNKMTALYVEQNIDGLYSFMQKNSTGEFKKMESILLYQRNKDWIPKIIEFTKNDAVFIAIGAGHLGGENGVIRLLKNKGYEVKPVKF